jgi:glycosyltransferase involved in cell wall biosynthesis
VSDGRELEAGLTVVIPAHDEEVGIGPTVAAIREAFAGSETAVEIVVVDDGSTDATAARAAAAGARVIAHPHRGGYGRALKSGIEAAAHGTIAIADGDGTYPVEELPRMLELARAHDLVIGARSGPLYRGTLLRSPLRVLFLLLSSFVAGQWIPDPNSGLRVFRRRDVVRLFPDLPRGFSFTTTQTLIMTLAGAFIHYHRVDYRPRIGLSKIRLVRQSLQVCQGLVEVVLRHNPWKLFLLAAMVPLLAMPLIPLFGAAAEAALLACVILASTSLLILALGMLAVVVLRRPPSESSEKNVACAESVAS